MARSALAIDLDSTLAALADPTRRRVVDLLRQRPRRAGELAREFRMSPPAMSRHLKVLRKGGLVEEQAVEDDARVRLYRLRPEPFEDLQDWLEQVEAYWQDQLGSFKAHAERKGKPAKPRAAKLRAAKPKGKGGRR